MDAVVTCGAALQLCQSPVAALIRSAPRVPLSSFGPPACHAPRAIEEALGVSLPAPEHLLVANGASRRNSATVTRRVMPGSTEVLLLASCPAPSTEGERHRIAVVPPELLVAQLAPSMSWQQAALLAYELCGSYSTADDGLQAREPLMSAADFKRFCSSQRTSGSIPGLKAVARWAPFVLDGAASPREAALALILTLPRAEGGYALPAPELNGKIDVPMRLRDAAGKGYFACDFLWRSARLAIEYESDEYHVGAQRIAEDSARRNALALLGIEVVTVTNRQFSSCDAMDAVVRYVTKRLGIPFRCKLRYDYRRRQLALRKSLIG